MKNTKILFIRLYIGTLYRNFIVPLRGSNYIQLLYGDLQQLLIFLLERQIRLLVWQERINGVGRKWGKSWAAFKVNLTGQNLDRSWTGTLLQLFSKVSPKMSSGGIKYHQNFIGLSSKNDHQTTTKTPPEITTGRVQMSVDECSFQPKEIGSIRVKSDQKIGVNRCKSVWILTSPGTKMRSNECGCGQKIGTNRDESGRKTGAVWGKLGQKMRVICDQMLPNATRKHGDQRRPKATNNDLLTYQRLILLNNLFMFCVGQKLL